MLKLSRKTALVLGLIGLNVAALTLPMVAGADTQNSDTDINLDVEPVILSYSSGPTVTLGAITPTVGGRQSTNSDTVNADTNDASGLTITLEEKSAVTTAMVSGGNSIDASAATPAASAALANGEWGWRIDSMTGSDFGAGPAGVLASAAPSALKYAGIPASGAPATIKTTATNGSTSATVWYSARVNTALPSGSYSTTVTYTFSTN